MQAVGETVYVAEWGHGARRGKVVHTYIGDNGRGRIIVKLDDQPCPRDCFAASVFRERERAERASLSE